MKYGTILLLLALVALPYVGAVNYGFVYDDHGTIEENPFLADPASLARVLTLRTILDNTITDSGRPAVILTYLADRAIGGVRPLGYHVTNLLLHLGVVLALFLFVRRLASPQESDFIPAATALLFGLHPVLTEAVQVPAFREDLLVALFVTLALLAATRKGAGALFALPALVLALLSKESAAVAPAILAWLWVCFPTLRPSRGFMTAILAGGVLVVLAFVTLWSIAGSLQAASEFTTGLGLPCPANFLTAPWLWLKTLRVLLVPWPLIADHVIVPVTSPWSARFLAGVAVGIAWVAGALRARHRAPRIAFAMGWSLLLFVPVANLVPLYNPFAERYLYFIAAGFALLVADPLSRVTNRQHRALALATICCVYCTLAFLRTQAWADDFTLWSDTLRREPRSARAHTWIGFELKKRGKIREAYENFVEADRLAPQDVSALINIAVIYGQQGLFEQAEAALREAVRRRPDKADAHWNLAVALHALGRDDEAVIEIEETLRLDPRHPHAHAARKERVVMQTNKSEASDCQADWDKKLTPE